MRKSIEVVDGFYRDPVVRRELALGSEWVAPDGASVFDEWTRDAFADLEATARIAALVGRDSDAAFPTLAGRFTFVGDGRVRDGQRAAPHVHDEQWAALVYLAPPEGGFSSGVEFHRPASAASTPGGVGKFRCPRGATSGPVGGDDVRTADLQPDGAVPGVDHPPLRGSRLRPHPRRRPRRPAVLVR